MLTVVHRSSTSTPTPSTQLDRANFLEAPKPFKNAAYGAKSANRRNKTLKQILVAERDLAMGLDGANGSGGGGSGAGSGKRKGKKGAEEVMLGPGGKRLVGAAAKAARKREEKERIQALKEETGDDSEADVTAMTGVEGDTSMADVSVTKEEPLTEEQKAEEEEKERQAREKELQRRRNIPSCERKKDTLSPIDVCD